VAASHSFFEIFANSFAYIKISVRKECSSNSIGDGPQTNSAEIDSHDDTSNNNNNDNNRNNNKRLHSNMIEVESSEELLISHVVPPPTTTLTTNQINNPTNHFLNAFGVHIAKHYKYYRVVSTPAEHLNMKVGQIIMPLNHFSLMQCTLRSHFDCVDYDSLKSYLRQ